MMTRTMPAPVEELGRGRYAILRELGSGAQGETLEAVDKAQGGLVAIKRFRIRGAKSWKSVELAEREARVLRGLDHPGLPRYVEHFEEEGCLYLVMAKLEGESIAHLRSQGRSFPEREVVRFLRDTGAVLDYLHRQAPPLIHRDIKPGNVIRRPDGSFSLVDFGSVRDSLKPEGGSTIVGTFGYMAPEQFQGRALPASDIYSAGATALAMMTGREPEALPHAGLGIDVPRALQGTGSGNLVRLLTAMVRPDPDQRPVHLLSCLDDLSLDPSEDRSCSDAWAPGATDRGFGAEGFAEHGGAWGTEPNGASSGARSRRRHHFRPSYRTGEGFVPGPLLLVGLTLGFAMARLVIFKLFRVIAPTLLVFLSLFVGPSLRRAAAAANELGKRIDQSLLRARERLQGSGWVADGTARQPRVRVAPYPEGSSERRRVHFTWNWEPADEDYPPPARARSRRHRRAK